MKHNFKGSIYLLIKCNMELAKIKIIVYLKLSKQPSQYFICIVNYNKHLIIIVYQNVKIVWPYASLRKVKKS